MGSDTLAGPISHMVNMSLSAGVFPSAFKMALIHPVYKGGGKVSCRKVSCRQQRCLVRRRSQEGRPHLHCGPAGGGKVLSLNQQVVRATAMSAWSAYVSGNGTGGTGNPVSSWMFGNVYQPATARPTRATTAGEVRVPMRGMDTHVTHGLKTWNACAELREARSKAEANRASTRLARKSPL
jgi:hypothetical protein